MMNKTLMIAKEKVTRSWYLIDAKDLILGRLATKISLLLQGKNKAIFTPHQDCGDYVIIINVSKLNMKNDRKWSQKIYYRHSQYPGGLKQIDAKTMFQKDPTWLLHQAVKGMLPKNRLQTPRIKRLFIYAGADHPHRGQNPITLGNSEQKK